MSGIGSTRIASGIAVVMVVLGAGHLVKGQSAKTPYPKMAALDQYLMTQDAEVALARTAAPESISKDAEVLVLDKQGYRTAIKGRNGFVCAVQRSWTATVDSADFWNPKLRAPICFNPPAARSFLPLVIKRTALVLGGTTKEQIPAAIKAALDSKEIPAIEPGAIGYMLSKRGYLNDHDQHWHPHVMMFTPMTDPAAWGANASGSPIQAFSDPTDRLTSFMVLVHTWSDGTPDAGDTVTHEM